MFAHDYEHGSNIYIIFVKTADTKHFLCFSDFFSYGGEMTPINSLKDVNNLDKICRGGVKCLPVKRV